MRSRFFFSCVQSKVALKLVKRMREISQSAHRAWSRNDRLIFYSACANIEAYVAMKENGVVEHRSR